MYLPLILIFIQYFFQSKQTGINSTTAKNCFLASNVTLFLLLLFVSFCFVPYLDPIKSIITILFLPKNFFFFFPLEFTNFIQTQCYQLPPSSVNIWLRYTECDLALTFSLLKMFSLIFCSFFLLCYEMHLICSFTFLVKWCPELDVIFQGYWHECYTVNDYYFLGF